MSAGDRRREPTGRRLLVTIRPGAGDTVAELPNPVELALAGYLCLTSSGRRVASWSLLSSSRVGVGLTRDLKRSATRCMPVARRSGSGRHAPPFRRRSRCWAAASASQSCDDRPPLRRVRARLRGRGGGRMCGSAGAMPRSRGCGHEPLGNAILRFAKIRQAWAARSSASSLERSGVPVLDAAQLTQTTSPGPCFQVEIDHPHLAERGRSGGS
jgi:hypothetical protein